jgi:hypothetical protein
LQVNWVIQTSHQFQDTWLGTYVLQISIHDLNLWRSQTGLLI